MRGIMKKRKYDCGETMPKKKSLKCLIGERQSVGDPLSQDSHLMLKEAIHQLISHHRNLDGLISEANHHDHGQIKGQPDVPLSHSVQGILSQLQEQAQTTATPFPSLVATVCAGKMKLLLADSEEKLLLTQQQTDSVEVLLGVVKEAQLNHGFSRNTFIKRLNKDQILPLELIWILNREGIMPYEVFISCNLNKPPIIGSFAHSLVELCQPSKKNDCELRKKILQDCLSWLIGQGYNDRTAEDAAAKGMKKVACALLDSITKKVLSEEFQELELCLFEVIGSSESRLEVSQLKRFCTRQIIVGLELNPVLKVSDALSLQSKWTFAQSPKFITSSYKQLFLPFEAAEVVDIIRRVLEQHEVNWQAVLTFTATFILCFPEAPSLLKELVECMLREGLENADLEAVITAFLLVRQACLEGTHVFPSYQDWFQETFGTENRSLAGNKKTFSFLLKFLTDIVPYEPASVLKAHVLKTPYVPAKCRPVLSDYVTLAKTRLADLKHPIDELGIYDEAVSTVDKDKVLKQAEQDVDRALSSFDKTSKLPASVMEACIFRKPYFIGRFLPTLLTPRPLPDTPDVRMKFIDALLKAEKIPSSLYSAYEKSCKKEAAQLLEGVFSDEDSMDDLLLPPDEQLSNALDALSEAVLTSHQDSKASGISSCISVVSAKIHSVLETEPGVPCNPRPATIELNTCSSSLPRQAVMIVDRVLDTICKLMKALEKYPKQNGTWVTRLMSMVCSHSTVVPALLSRMWALLIKQGCHLMSHHLSGLAAILLHMVTFPDWLGHVTAIYAGETGPFCDLLLQFLTCNTKTWMEISLRFFTLYLTHAVKTFHQFSLVFLDGKQAVVPPIICKKFDYLVMRICNTGGLESLSELPGSGTDNLQEIKTAARHIYESKVYKDLKLGAGLTYEEWVKLELPVIPHEDFMDFASRLGFLEDTACKHYLPLPKCDGGCQGSVHQACTTILAALLENDQSTSSVRPCQNCSLNTGAPSADSKIQLLQLLQHLTTGLLCQDLNHKDQVSSSWLAGQLLERLEPQKSQHCHLNTNTGNTCFEFFRLARYLSPHLLFSDSLVSPLSGSTAMDNITKIINQTMRNYLSTGVVLDVLTAKYLLQGLQILDRASAENDKLVSTVLQECPLVAASLVVQWSVLKSNWLNARNNSSLSVFMQDVDKIHKWAYCEKPDTEPCVWMEQKCFVLSAAVYSTCLRGRVPETWLIRWTNKYPGRSADGIHEVPVLLGCLCLVLGHLAESLMYGKESEVEDELFSAAEELIMLTQLPDISQGRCVIPSYLNQILPDRTCLMMPVMILRVIDKATPDKLTEFSKQPLFLSKMLSLHVITCKLYDNGTVGGDSIVANPDWPAGLTAGTVGEGVNVIKKVLGYLPHLISTKVDKALITKCDPQVQAALRLAGM